MFTHYKNIVPFITKDGSEIRELMHPSEHGNVNQSLAEATVAPGAETQQHKHMETEEIYHITQGKGLMRLGEDLFEVMVGDSVCIEARLPLTALVRAAARAFPPYPLRRPCYPPPL